MTTVPTQSSTIRNVAVELQWFGCMIEAISSRPDWQHPVCSPQSCLVQILLSMATVRGIRWRNAIPGIRKGGRECLFERFIRWSAMWLASVSPTHLSFTPWSG